MRTFANDRKTRTLFLAACALAVTFIGAGTAHAQLLTNGMPADNVFGQPDFASFAAATTQNGLSLPEDMVFDGGHNRLFIADTGNNRVMVYDLSGGIFNAMNAGHVLGQPDFVSGGADTQNNGFGCNSTPNACGMNSPTGLYYDVSVNRLFVVEAGNHRATVYDLSGGIADGMPAAHVIGQPDFVTATANTACGGGSSGSVNACGLWFPFGAYYDSASKRLFLDDLFNSRVLVYDLTAGIADGQAAVHVLGQTGFTTRDQNAIIPGFGCNSAVNACGMLFPNHVSLDASNRLFVSDGAYNYRVLVFDLSGGVADGMPAANVLGQPDFTTGYPGPNNTACGGGPGTPNPCGFDFPGDIAIDNVKHLLYVTDDGNHRVMIFDTSGGIVNGMAATKVLGHADLNTGEGYVFAPPFYGGEQYQNPAYGCNGSPNACSLDGASGIDFDPVRQVLFQADFNANRVLVYGANMDGYTFSISGATSIITITNLDGSKTYLLTDANGNHYQVTLPSGTKPLNGNTTINVTFDTSLATRPGLKIDALLPAGQTKKAQVPRGTGNRLCIKDKTNAQFGTSSCTGGNLITLPAAGNCGNFTVLGDAGDNGSPTGSHTVNVCVDLAATKIDGSLLLHTVLQVLNDTDGDGVADADDWCPNTNLAGPIPTSGTLRPNHLGDASVDALGCNASQILACKPGNGGGEQKFGVTPGSQNVFESMTSPNPIGWAAQCAQMYPHP